MTRLFLLVIVTFLYQPTLSLESETYAVRQAANYPPQSRREGSFLVTGVLADEDARPLAGWTIEALEVGDKGGMLFKIKDGLFLGFAGTAMTDAMGVFRITVQRSYFDGAEMRMALRTYEGKSANQFNPHREIQSKGGGLAMFVVDDATKELNLTKIFGGPITVHAKK